MKRHFLLPAISSILCCLVALLPGCMKDKITRTYTITVPITQSLSKFREQIQSQPAMPITTTGKVTLAGRYIFVSEANQGIHVIDNRNPSSPKNISFIYIPGNIDMAIKGNTLYADSYGDLVTFDITDPTHVIAKDFETYVFPDRSMYYTYNFGVTTNPDSILIITGYTTKDTVIDDPGNGGGLIYTQGGCPTCSSMYLSAAPSYAANPGINIATNGSMARFGIVGNFLYAIGTFNLSSFNISNAFKPVLKSALQVDFHSETIFPLKNNLFVGTNDGMYMYDVQSSPDSPRFLGKFTHMRGCDPVIADEDYAYITLNDSSACLGFDNELQIIDIHDMANSYQINAYKLAHPIGLSKDANLLFVCDSWQGLKIYDATNPRNLQLIKQLQEATVYDVIAQDGNALVMASDGIYQYDYSDLSNIHLISKL